jgi:quinol monooxygenase YgiN
MSERIKNLPGCIDCRVYLDVQKNCSLLFDQVWESAEDLNRHIRSDEYRNILLVMEMAAEKPEIRFETISNVTGMETIEKLRTDSEIHI